MISIIVPVYNGKPYLEKCLDSIVAQTYKDIEVICVNGNSTDGTDEVLKKYTESDFRIRVIHKENEGVSISRNTALDMAKGEYVLFVDADDWIELDTCETALKVIEEKNTDLVMWSYIRERAEESTPKKIFSEDVYFDKEMVAQKLHRRMIGITDEELAFPENADALCTVWGKLYRRSIIEEHKIRFYDIRKIGTYEDGLFNLNYMKYVQNAMFLNQYFYHYRRTNTGSITSVYNEKLGAQWNRLFELMEDYIKREELNVEYEIALNNRIALSLIPLGINEMEHQCSSWEKIKHIKQIISTEQYVQAVRVLEIKYMPIHWKLFFGAAKCKMAIGVFSLLKVIQKIRGR